MDLRLTFVLSRFQNAFFLELAEVLSAEARLLGVESSVHTSGALQPAENEVFVIVPPHEYFALEGLTWALDSTLMCRTIFLSAEQPGSSFFGGNMYSAHYAGAVFDFSALAVDRYRHLGVAADHLQFGYTASWDFFHEDTTARDIDVLFLGCMSAHRGDIIGRFADVADHYNARFVISDNSAPNYGTSDTFVTGADKRALLARTRLLINVHQHAEPYFEWLRVAEAAMCGAVVVSEPSLATGIFTPHQHYIAATPSRLAITAEAVLENAGLENQVRREAYEQVKDHPLSAAVTQLVDRGMEIRKRSRPAKVAHTPTRTQPLGPAPSTTTSDPGDELELVRLNLRETRLDLIETRRSLARLARQLGGDDSRTATVAGRTAAAREARRPPRVSVIVALYNHSDYIAGSLESVARSSYRDLEILIVDDGSTDQSGPAVRSWMDSRPRCQATLLEHPINRGLPVARNVALDWARGEYVFVLDADNELLHHGLARLVDALDSDDNAWFAFGMLQQFDDRGPRGVMGVFPWDESRLKAGNYIDAMALLRAERLRELGGYTTDRRLYGWEDYDLWCRIAEAGGFGTHLATFVGRYRSAPGSMLSLSNLSTVAARAALAERAPGLMASPRTEVSTVAYLQSIAALRQSFAD